MSLNMETHIVKSRRKIVRNRDWDDLPKYENSKKVKRVPSFKKHKKYPKGKDNDLRRLRKNSPKEL